MTARGPRPPRVWEYVCWACGETKTIDQKPPAGLSCGAPACVVAHNAAVVKADAEHRAALAAHRAANPRRPRTYAPPVGDPNGWAAVGALNGYRRRASPRGRA